MRIAGVDPDTKNVTIAWFASETEHGYKVVSPPKMRQSRAEHRFLPLADAFMGWLADEMAGFDFVYVEKPMYTRNAAATIWQSAVMGMVLATLHLADVACAIIDPGTWKKETVGLGNASKEQVAEWAQANLGLAEGLPQDVYDAYCIAWRGYLKARHEA